MEWEDGVGGVGGRWDREKRGGEGRRERGEWRGRREIRTKEEGQSGWERDGKRGRMDVPPMFLRY